MLEDFGLLLARTREEHGASGVIRLWLGTALDTVVSGFQERMFGTRVNQYIDEEGMMGEVTFHMGQAVRRLRRAPGYVCAFVVTLGLAIGVNSAVFSVVHGVLLQPLPFQDAERIVYLKQPITSRGIDNAMFSFMEIDDYRSASTSVGEFVEFGDWEFTVLGEGQPHRAVGGLVTSNYFEVLGMRPLQGRALDERDDLRGAEPVMVLTHAYWESALGSDPGAVGRSLDLENLNLDGGDPFTPVRVVGILEPGLHYTGSRQPDFYVNYAANDHYQDAAMRDARDHRMTDVFARLAPGVSLSSARSELESINRQMHAEHPDIYRSDLGYGITAVPWEAELTANGRSTFLLLMGTVGIVLLLAAFNVTNLTLTRLIRKEAELSTRAALGARTRDLRLQLTAEHAVLGLAGGVLGILIAFVSRDSLVSYASRFTVRAQEVGVDWTVLGVTLGGGMLVSVLLAWMPGLPMGRVGSIASVRSRATATPWRKRLQRGLVVSQLALSFALLTGAGLLVRSLIELTRVDPGFETQRILVLETPTGPSGRPLPFIPEAGWEAALEEIRALPGIHSAAVATWAPLSGESTQPITATVEGREDVLAVAQPAAPNSVSLQYFDILGIPLVRGRYFDETDTRESPDVVILNESMARAYFGEVDPIGQRITVEADLQSVFLTATYEVVGIVADTREYAIDSEGEHTFYRPAVKTTWGPTILVTHSGEVAPVSDHIRDVIHRMEPDRAVEEVRTLASLVDREMAPSKLNALLFGSFAILALLIAAVGVLGTLAFSVSQRVREFGIRIALGADRASVLANVLTEVGLMVGGAFLIGGVAAVALGRFLVGFLYGVDPVDATTMAAAAALLGAVALGAALSPALRATRVHPAEALRAAD